MLKDKVVKENNEQLKGLKEHLESNEKIPSERDAVLMKTTKKHQNATEQIKKKNTHLEK